jgi:hypothetical protein
MFHAKREQTPLIACHLAASTHRLGISVQDGASSSPASMSLWFPLTMLGWRGAD